MAIYTDGSVTKDQFGLGSTVKHCGKTTQEDGDINSAMNFKLTGEVETVIYIVQWRVSHVDTKITHARITAVHSLTLKARRADLRHALPGL